MKGILIIAHGSRRKETLDTMEQVFKMVQDNMPDIIVEHAYMEFCDINLEKGLDLLREKGVTEIVVVPYFLFDGMHIIKDIPEEIEAYLESHKDMKITMGKTLGADKRIADVLCDRIKEVL
ncbi:MAG: CbiX/SirB N-terminal domain-containing protein [Mucispirillum sp.]|nr:CbiX/SirB N-terminal domain-containing protein [Mucispirillum sp.]